MLDSNGNLLTTDNSIKDRALKVYSERLEPNEMEENLKELEIETNNVCELRMKECKENKSDLWDEDDLKLVLKQLLKNKSWDPEGLANEIFN